MSNVEVLEGQPRGVVATMAQKFNMRPESFEATVRATCSPAPKRDQEAVPLTREEFAAFILVANHYDLNPLTREIFAYPKRGGGIVPVVSIDGWVNLINRQPACDGWDMVADLDKNGFLKSYTCTMYRKDRAHPCVVTEFLSECFRDTEPWKMMKNRMLRHKALVQSGRYAFGFAGIYDEDEARTIAGVEDASEKRRAPAPPIVGEQGAAPGALAIEHKPDVVIDLPTATAPETVKAEAAGVAATTAAPAHRRAPPPPQPSAKPAPAPAFDFAAHKIALAEALEKAYNIDAIDDIYARFWTNVVDKLTGAQKAEVKLMCGLRENVVNGDSQPETWSGE
jgi:hypothetical protein